MTYLSDTLTVGLVLVLLFGSVALYLYTRIQQSEQKVSLLESILLDMKMSSEIKSYTELPADELFAEHSSHAKTPTPPVTPHPSEEYEPFDDVQINLEECEDLTNAGTVNPSVTPSTNELDLSANEVVDYRAAVRDALEEHSLSSEKPSYDSMTLKELQALAKSRGVSSSAKKGPLIELLKAYDSNKGVSGSNGVANGVANGLVNGVANGQSKEVVNGASMSSSSFLETSASVSDELA